MEQVAVAVLKAADEVLPNSIHGVEEEIKRALRQQEALAEKLEQLQRRKAELSIWFSEEGGDVLIHGVAAQPLRATKRQWMQFLNLEGARKLREFITNGGK